MRVWFSVFIIMFLIFHDFVFFKHRGDYEDGRDAYDKRHDHEHEHDGRGAYYG